MGKLDLIGIKNLKIELPKLNILNILGYQRDENTYSDVIYYLLKSEAGNVLIKNILENAKINHPNEINDTKFEVIREYHRLDVTILFNNIKYLIGIENKIDADERENQIKDYQSILQKYYSDYSGVFIFLTPEGREPSSNNKDSKYKCYSISYKELLKYLYEIKEIDSIKSCVNTFIDSIEENIVMNDHNLDTVYEIWGNKSNRDKLKVLLQNRPTILSIKDELYGTIDEYLAENADGIDYDLCEEWKDTELSLRVKSLSRKNIPVTFLFYDDWKTKENTPALRIAILRKDFDNMSQKRINSYKEKYDFLAFERIKGWSAWYALYTGKSLEPDFIVTEDHNYKDKLVNILFKEFKKEYNKIKKLVE